MKHFIYKTTNLITGKYYVGKHSTNNINDGYMGSGASLKRAIKKYGKENFRTDIIMYFSSAEEALEYESYIVDEEFIKSKYNYNMKVGGKGGWDHVHLIPFSEAHRRKISEAHKGQMLSDETKIKISNANKGVPKVGKRAKGIPLPKKHRQNISKGKTGVTFSKEHCENLRGPKSKEHRANMSKPRIKTTCPHCNYTGGSNNMNRWHFDNCKMKQDA